MHHSEANAVDISLLYVMSAPLIRPCIYAYRISSRFC